MPAAQSDISVIYELAFACVPTYNQAVVETATLSQLDIPNLTAEDPGGNLPSVTDTLDSYQTASITLVEATAETTTLSQTSDQPGLIADPGNTYDVSQTNALTVAAEAVQELVRVIQTAQLTMDTLGDESENQFLTKTNVFTAQETVVGSIIEIRRLVQELVISITETIRSDIDALTISQQNVQSILEAFDELSISQTMTFSMDEFIPQTVDALTLLMRLTS
jgi:hypothetical protein